MPEFERKPKEPEISAEDAAKAAKILGEEQKLAKQGEVLTPEEEIKLSQFKVTAKADNQMPSDEEVEAEKARIVAERASKKEESDKKETVEDDDEPEIIEGVYTEVEEDGREKKGSGREEKKERQRSFVDEVSEVEVLDPRDRAEAYKGIQKQLLKDKPEDWIEKLKVLREKMDEADILIKIGKVDVSEAERRFENLQNPMAFGGNIKQQKEAARRWLENYRGKTGISQEMIASVENIFQGEEVKFIFDEEKKINEEDSVRKFCLEEVFERNANNSQHVYNLLTGPGGYLRTGLFKTPEEAEGLIKRTKEIVDELGIDNWIAVRENIKAWGNFKGVEDVTINSLTTSLFLPEYAEMFFAGEYSKDGVYLKERKIVLPENKEAVDIQKEISRAMKTMKAYFDKTDYYTYVGSTSTIKKQLFDDLGINKYAGEVAFSLLLSHLIVTECDETSTDDPFMMMINGAKRRVKAYDVSEYKDPVMRARIQALLVANKSVIEAGKIKESEADKIKSYLSKSLPCHLIPTGRSDGGLEALERGNWLKWRVDNTSTKAERNFEIAQINEAKGKIMEMVARKNGLTLKKIKKLKDTDPDEFKRIKNEAVNNLKKVNDTETRIDEMKSALNVLISFRDAMKPESDISSLLKCRAALAVHTKVHLKAGGWVDADGKIDKEFGYGVVYEGGKPVRDERNELSHDEWATQAMLTVNCVYLYVHSGTDHANKKPWNLQTMAENAIQILSREPQSDKDALLGFDKKIRDKYRKAFVSYVDYLESCTRDVFDVAKDRRSLNKLPKWYNTGGGISDEIMKTALDSEKPDQTRAWRRYKEMFKL